jgi:site-specific DNA-methyltransferase (adenine-specific)
MILITNEDNMKLMRRYHDKYFDLAIVDPPYGGGNHCMNNKICDGVRNKSYGKRDKMNLWDNPPDEKYFRELFRVSNYQIICGGNYFNLPPKRNFIIFRKSNIPETFNMAMCEYLWTNIGGNAKIFDYFSKHDPNRFHPCQKPVSLYKWLLSRFAKEGWKILDTHIGSGSIAIACIDLGFDLTGCEIDTDYFNVANERIKEYRAQLTLDFGEKH